MSSIKMHFKNILKITAVLILIYVVYRIVNVIAVDAISAARQDELKESRHYPDRVCADFESPGPLINDVIDYDNLALCHRLVVSREEYEANENYGFQTFKTNFSFMYLPWTMDFDLGHPDNYENRHQYNSYGDIDVWIEQNVFSGAYEEMVLHGNATIELLALIPLILAAVIEAVRTAMSREKNRHSGKV